MSLLLSLAIALAAAPAADDPVTPADRLAHEQMLTLDSHLDTPIFFEIPGWDFSSWHNFDFDKSQVDIPRMEQGGLDGGFFVIYTGQGPLTPEGIAKARNAALTRAMWIQRVVAANSDKLELAYTADDAQRIAKMGKRIVYQSIENSYPLGNDLNLLQYYYDLGVRMVSPVHSRNNQFSDSTTGQTKQWGGFSPLGRAWLAEVNRLGMIVDMSHASDDTFDQALTLSKTPIILSHSGPKAIFDHPRNLDDDRMRKLAKAGGVMQINSVFLVPFDNDPIRSAVQKRQDGWGQLSPEEQRQLMADKSSADAQNPYAAPTFELFMQSVLHAIKIMGVDHVGIGADWDGGGGVNGMEDIATLPKITARLRREGVSDTDIEKIWSGNLLRLLRQAEQWAQANAGK